MEHTIDFFKKVFHLHARSGVYVLTDLIDFGFYHVSLWNCLIASYISCNWLSQGGGSPTILFETKFCFKYALQILER